MSVIRHKSWLFEVGSGGDLVRKLNAFLLFLWENAFWKLRIPSHLAKCKLLSHTLIYIFYICVSIYMCFHVKFA